MMDVMMNESRDRKRACDVRAVAEDGLPSTANQLTEDNSIPAVKASNGKVSRDCDCTNSCRTE